MEQRADRIVVGIDDSTGGRAALRDAARRGASVDARVLGRHVRGLAGRPVLDLDDVRAAIREHATRHGHLAGTLLGSVGRRCVLHSPCPLTVVHAPPSAVERVRSHVGGGPPGGR